MGGWTGPIIIFTIFGAIVLLLIVMFALHRIRQITNGRIFAWLRARLGRGKSIKQLARRLDMGEMDLREFRPSYQRIAIPKKRGGYRQLLVPEPRTKELQRRLLHRLFARLRAHPAATGFERGKSIVDNALPHVRRAVVIRMDVIDFFPSTTADRIQRYFQRIGWNKAAASLLVKLCTMDGSLPQGAPTSPRLSNLVNFNLDTKIESYVARRGGRYTRYADDITISFAKDRPRHVRGTIQHVARILKANSYRIHKRKKLSIRRRHQKQVVTGLIVNEGVRLPRKMRMRLRAMRHRLSLGRELSVTPLQWQGLVAFEQMVEGKQVRE